MGERGATGRAAEVRLACLLALAWVIVGAVPAVTAQDTTSTTSTTSAPTTTTSTTSSTTSTTSTTTSTTEPPASTTSSPSSTTSTSAPSTTTTAPTRASATTTPATAEGDGSRRQPRSTEPGATAKRVLTTGGRPAVPPTGEGLGRPPELRRLVEEDEAADDSDPATPTARNNRAGPLVAGGFVVGPLVGLILGLRDRAAAAAVSARRGA